MSALKTLSKYKAAIGIAAVVATLVYLNQTGVLTSDKMKSQMKDNKDWIQQNLFQGVLLVVVIDFLFIICIFPGSWFLELFSGYVFGLYVGSATILFAKCMAACACFFLGKTLLSGWVKSLIKSYPAFKTFHQASGSDGWQLVLAARLSPLPSYVCSYGFSITSVSFKDYALSTLLASGPMVVQNVYMGSLVQSIEELTTGPGGGGASKWLQMALPFVGMIAILWWTQRFMAKLSKKKRGPGSPVASRLRTRTPSARAASPAAEEGSTPAKSPRRRTPSRSRARSPAPAKSPRARTPSKRAKSPKNIKED